MGALTDCGTTQNHSKSSRLLHPFSPVECSTSVTVSLIDVIMDIHRE